MHAVNSYHGAQPIMHGFNSHPSGCCKGEGGSTYTVPSLIQSVDLLPDQVRSDKICTSTSSLAYFYTHLIYSSGIT